VSSYRQTKRVSTSGGLLVGGLMFGLAAMVPARAEQAVQGVYALPDGKPQVAATLAMTPEGGLRRRLDIAMTPVGATTPVRRYDVELSKQLHLIAVDGALRTFVHEHADRPDASGHFHVSATFPHPGLWGSK